MLPFVELESTHGFKCKQLTDVSMHENMAMEMEKMFYAYSLINFRECPARNCFNTIFGNIHIKYICTEAVIYPIN